MNNYTVPETPNLPTKKPMRVFVVLKKTGAIIKQKESFLKQKAYSVQSGWFQQLQKVKHLIEKRSDATGII